MLGSFDRCKYMNVCKLLNLCMFFVDKLRVTKMLMLIMNIWGMLMLRVNVGMGEC